MKEQKNEEMETDIVETEGNVVRIQPRQLIPIDRVESIIQLADQSERLMGALKKIRQEVLSLTNENDWSDQNGTPYLEGSGCQKVARWYGVSWKFLGEPARVDLGDGHYRYDVKMAFWKNDDYVECIGTRASNDPFFTAHYVYDEKEKKRVKVYRHPREVDSGNVLKAAITNGMQGILSFLGMKKLSWDDLNGAGLNVGKIMTEKRIPYAKNKPEDKKPRENGKPQSTPEEKPPEPKNEPGVAETAVEGEPVRNERPENPLSDKQLQAITNLMKYSKEPLHKITYDLFGVGVDNPEFITFDEAKKVIGYFSSKIDQAKKGGK